jgi:serine/threonine-protein kinase
MEYVDGRPLSAVLRPGQPMAPAAAARLVAATGDALGAAHAQGIVHRDVKPANILVTDDRRVKITDFGIARAADAVALTRTGEVLGTPQYISPEQAEGRPATPASDVYALGAVAYECLAGQRPYEADSPVATALAHLRQPVPELPSTVPAPLAAVVRRALAKAPDERYPDGAAFAAAVREGLDAPAADPATTQVLPAGTSWGTRARRVPVPVWAAAGVLVLVVAVAALASLTTGGDGTPPPPGSTKRPVSHQTSSSGSSSPTSSLPTRSTPPGHGHDTGPGDEHGKAKGHEKHGEGG